LRKNEKTNTYLAGIDTAMLAPLRCALIARGDCGGVDVRPDGAGRGSEARNAVSRLTVLSELSFIRVAARPVKETLPLSD